MKYTKHYSKVQTPQSQPIPGTNQAQNNAGGYSFQVDDFTRLDRFLILGSEGGTYYVRARKLTVDNAKCVERCLDQDHKRTIDRIVEISHSGRAPKNDPALFALALAASHKEPECRSYALQALPKVARMSTHLFHFADAVQNFRGWGRALRKAIAGWYTDKPAKKIALQAIKYQQRDGWSHRDLLRLAHPEAPTDDHQAVFRYITKGREQELTPEHIVPVDLRQIWAFERIKQVEDIGEAIKIVQEYRLPHECVPNQFKKSPDMWAALLEDMPMGAMVRNLGRMTSIQLIKPGSKAAKTIVERLQNQELVKNSRLHPLAVLIAKMTYDRGHGTKGSLSWGPVNMVQDALEDAFYLSFDNVEPTNKLTLIGLDVSGSMSGPWGSVGVCGVPGLSPRVAAACMCMVTARAEPDYQIIAFSHQLIPLKITKKDSLNSVVRKTSGLSFGATDCALPMLYALQTKTPYENFIVYTDSETWCGKIHPSQALKMVRKELGVPAKLAVVAMEATNFSIADPTDAGMMDFVGFDTAAPAVLADFLRQ